MNQQEYLNKVVKVYRQWVDNVHNMSMKELKEYIKKSPKRAILHELELNHRINGGMPPIYIIAHKIANGNHGFKSVNIDSKLIVTFDIT